MWLRELRLCLVGCRSGPCPRQLFAGMARSYTMHINTLFAMFVVLLLAASLSGCGEPKLPSPFQASDVSAKYAGANFHLTDHNGQPRSLVDYRGKVVVLFFGYIHCPDVCPTTLADLAHGQDAERVQVLFATLDPQRDTPELLAKFVPAFYPTFLALVGDEQTTDQAARAFGVSYQKQPGKNSNYTLDHFIGTYLIGTSGKPVLLAPYGQRAELLAQDIKLLLRMAR